MESRLNVKEVAVLLEAILFGSLITDNTDSMMFLARFQACGQAGRVFLPMRLTLALTPRVCWVQDWSWDRIY